MAIIGANSAVGRVFLRRAAAEREGPLVFVAAVRLERAAADFGPLLDASGRVAQRLERRVWVVPVPGPVPAATERGTPLTGLDAMDDASLALGRRE